MGKDRAKGFLQIIRSESFWELALFAVFSLSAIAAARAALYRIFCCAVGTDYAAELHRQQGWYSAFTMRYARHWLDQLKKPFDFCGALLWLGIGLLAAGLAVQLHYDIAILTDNASVLDARHMHLFMKAFDAVLAVLAVVCLRQYRIWDAIRQEMEQYAAEQREARESAEPETAQPSAEEAEMKLYDDAFHVDRKIREICRAAKQNGGQMTAEQQQEMDRQYAALTEIAQRCTELGIRPESQEFSRNFWVFPQACRIQYDTACTQLQDADDRRSCLKEMRAAADAAWFYISEAYRKQEKFGYRTQTATRNLADSMKLLEEQVCGLEQAAEQIPDRKTEKWAAELRDGMRELDAGLKRRTE